MRVVTYRSERGERAGVLRDEGVVDAWDLLDAGHQPASVRALLEADRLDELGDRLGQGQAPKGVPLGKIALRPPVPDPDKIVCLGLNYRSHAEEQGAEPPDSPTFFAKFRNALVGTGEPVQRPATSAKIDYEGEIAFVSRREAKDVSAGEGLGPRRRVHAPERPLGARPPDANPAMDAGEGVRRLCPVRACARHPR
jgi:acylpyruvate hydrolase